MFKKLFSLTGALAVLLAFLCGISVSAQNKAVRGKVVDNDGGPVIGAYVTLVGSTSVGTVTDVNGAFSLNVPAGANLEISCIGYATQVIAVGDKAVINVVLEEDAELLEEISAEAVCPCRIDAGMDPHAHRRRECFNGP